MGSNNPNVYFMTVHDIYNVFFWSVQTHSACLTHFLVSKENVESFYSVSWKVHILMQLLQEWDFVPTIKYQKIYSCTKYKDFYQIGYLIVFTLIHFLHYLFLLLCPVKCGHLTGITNPLEHKRPYYWIPVKSRRNSLFNQGSEAHLNFFEQ